MSTTGPRPSIAPRTSVRPARGNVCAAHGLALGPDGKCVVCRRSSKAPAQPQPTAASEGRPWLWVGIGAVLIALGGGAILGLEARAHRGEVTAEAETVPTPTAADPERARDPHVDERAIGQRAPMELPDPSNPNAALESPEPTLVVADAAGPTSGSGPAEKPLDVASLMAQTPITVYTTSWCGVCKKARAFLDQNNVRYREYDIEADETARARAAALNPRLSVPTFDIDGEVEIGFSPQGFTSIWSSALSKRAGRRVDVTLR